MVDLKQQPQQNANQNKNDNKGNDHRQPQRGNRPEEKRKVPDAIPILKYEPLMKFNEALSKKALLEFSNLGL
jgi:hypothetical protein